MPSTPAPAHGARLRCWRVPDPLKHTRTLSGTGISGPRAVPASPTPWRRARGCRTGMRACVSGSMTIRAHTSICAEQGKVCSWLGSGQVWELRVCVCVCPGGGHRGDVCMRLKGGCVMGRTLPLWPAPTIINWRSAGGGSPWWRREKRVACSPQSKPRRRACWVRSGNVPSFIPFAPGNPWTSAAAGCLRRVVCSRGPNKPHLGARVPLFERCRGSLDSGRVACLSHLSRTRPCRACVHEVRTSTKGSGAEPPPVDVQALSPARPHGPVDIRPVHACVNRKI